MSRGFLALVAVALAAPVARADMGPMFPLMKLARATHRIETQDAHPDHVFVLYHDGFQFDAATNRWLNCQEAEYVEITPAQPLVLNVEGHPREDHKPSDKERVRVRAMLVVAPRAAARVHKTALDLANDWELQGASRDWFDCRTTVPSWSGDESVLTYRVQRNQAGTGLETVRTSGDPLRQWKAAGVFLCVAVTLAVVLAGFWFVRRVFRRPHRSAV